MSGVTTATKSSTRMTHAERTELSDSRMFRAAVESIVEQGTENTRLKDVGERAGYSRGLAGSRFKSKQGLFCFVIKRVSEYWLDEMKQATEGQSGYEAVCAVSDAHYRFCKQAPVEVRAFYILWFEAVGNKGPVQEVIVDIHKKRLNDVIRWIEQGIVEKKLSPRIDAAAVAKQYLMTISGIIYQWLIDPQQEAEIDELYNNLKSNLRLLLPAANAQSN